ncbi:MAG: aldehyde dehydrogenase EutE [Candidatus Eisenbacteria bacterium]|nr:aldehyde dehydrogenase EutE [Candidatus Eisenbacteria bacterium]
MSNPLATDRARPLDPALVESIAAEVLARLRGGAPSRSASSGGMGLFLDLDAAMEAAERAFRALQELPLETRRNLIEAMRQVGRAEATTVARLAVEETKLGRVEDKIQKNLLVAEKTPGLEILEAWAVSGDHGLTLEELAPWGVIAAIAPCTNPTETILCNGIGMVAAGNAVVFGPHPLAQKTSAHFVGALNRAIVAAGGPENLIVALLDPTIEKAQALMRHPKARLVVVTGGPDVVREAMKTGKRVIAAGPGNPPALVDETADLEKAGRDIVRGASLDNNIICTDEKEVIAVASITDRLKAAMEAAGGVELLGPQIERLANTVLSSRALTSGDGREARVNKNWIGQDAAKILDAIGARGSREPRLLFAEVEADHPFVWTELLMPVIPVVRVKSFEAALDLAVAAEKGCRHTATMHSKDVTRLTQMARRIDASIFVKNGPAFSGLGMGGEGFTSFTIAGPTGEGMTTARSFCRRRRCTLVDAFRIV